jgi:hypothetical protein
MTHTSYSFQHTPGSQAASRHPMHRSAAKVRGSLTQDARVRADLMHVLGTVCMNLGLFAQAEPLFEESPATRRHLLGEEHPDTLSAMVSLMNAPATSSQSTRSRARRASAAGRSDPEPSC